MIIGCYIKIHKYMVRKRISFLVIFAVNLFSLELGAFFSFHPHTAFMVELHLISQDPPFLVVHQYLTKSQD